MICLGLLPRVNTERFPEYDVARPDTVDYVLHDALAKKLFRACYRGDFKSVESHERQCWVFINRSVHSNTPSPGAVMLVGFIHPRMLLWGCIVCKQEVSSLVDPFIGCHACGCWPSNRRLFTIRGGFRDWKHRRKFSQKVVDELMLGKMRQETPCYYFAGKTPSFEDTAVVILNIREMPFDDPGYVSAAIKVAKARIMYMRAATMPE